MASVSCPSCEKKDHQIKELMAQVLSLAREKPPRGLKDPRGFAAYCSGCTHWVHLHGTGCHVGHGKDWPGETPCPCPATYKELRKDL